MRSRKVCPGGWLLDCYNKWFTIRHGCYLSQFMGRTLLTDLLSQIGKEIHDPFLHKAVACLFLSSYASSHVTLILSPSLYQPSGFSVYFALGIVGRVQAVWSEEKKMQTTSFRLRRSYFMNVWYWHIKMGSTCDFVFNRSSCLVQFKSEISFSASCEYFFVA